MSFLASFAAHLETREHFEVVTNEAETEAETGRQTLKFWRQSERLTEEEGYTSIDSWESKTKVYAQVDGEDGR